MVLWFLLLIVVLIFIWVQEFKSRKVLMTIFTWIGILFLLSWVRHKAQKENLEDLVFDYIREDMAVNTQIDSCEGDYLDQWICMLNVCTESMGVKLRFIEDFHDFLD